MGNVESGFRWIEGGVSAARGWRAGAVASGIKPSGKPDLALIFSASAAVAAGSFTTNRVQAASVVFDRELLRTRSTAQAVVVNSGNANAATGQAGEEAVARTVAIFSGLLNVSERDILVASTGVIGVPLPVERINKAAPALIEALTDTGSDAAAQAILTTDLVAKQCAVEALLGGCIVRVGGIAKGSGMIHPQMATMLAFITSDCAVEATLWRAMTQRAVDASFNQITVDGDTSTNDLLLTLANGQAANVPVTDPACAEAVLLEQMLTAVCVDLARKVVRDGEGATKLIEVRVSGTRTDSEARIVARTVTGSSLVKSAMFGNDPNWGRLAAAAGRAGVDFDPTRLAVRLGEFQLMEVGQPLVFDRGAASRYLKESDPVAVQIRLGEGPGEGCAWGCDLSYDYVKINAEYTT